jgi:GT2 family glycosyltransferase
MTGPPDPGQPAPALSVVVSSYNSRSTVDACLSSLLRQEIDKQFEVILVDSSADGTAEHIRQCYPGVFLLTSGERLYCGDARNRALEVARAPVIAFLDADCYVEPDWAKAVLEAHRRPHWLVGGAIHNGSRRGVTAWAYYFCEFSLWLPRARTAEISEIAGCCLSFKREAFEKYGPFLGGTYSSDTAFQWRARRDGHKVLCSPAIRVFHTCESSAGEYLAHLVEHRRFFMQVARSQRKLDGAWIWLLAVLSPLYPFLLMGLTAWRALQRPRFLGRFLLASPLVFVGCCARAWGELTGLFAHARATDSNTIAAPVR